MTINVNGVYKHFKEDIMSIKELLERRGRNSSSTRIRRRRLLWRS